MSAGGVAAELKLIDARTIVAEHLAATGAVTRLSLDRFTALWARFERFANVSAVTRVAEIDLPLAKSFVDARTTTGFRPSPATSHLRRSALRLLFRVLRELRLAGTDPTQDLRLPPRNSSPLRALTDDEVDLCRWASLRTMISTRRPTVWALAESGAAAAEIGSVRLGDIDIATGAVWLRGSAKTDPRYAALTEWGGQQVRKRLTELRGSGASRLLTYEGAPSEHSSRTSTAASITLVIRHAGLGNERDVRVRSVTAWAGTKVLAESGRIDEVARYLGLRSLDLAANLVGFNWQEPE